MPTPHMSAQPADFAETVLMPGDPLRAKYIAETFLDDHRLVTSVRNMFGFTGTYKGKPISVQGSGMGVPSIQIYATELAQHYGVKRIIRVGSCGALQDHIELRDIVVGLGAGTDSMVNRARFEGRDFAAIADWGLVRAVVEASEDRGLPIHVGQIFTSDTFYEPEGRNTFELLERYGVLAVEMEAAGLYGVAAEHGIAALAVATVSDQIKRNEVMSVEDRQSSFDDMITLVLDAMTATD
ncbi:MAG: purine-nucleoside phosphorylase [Actinomycetia bacterium]|nr:purine-nucleoside phosphorylase [Actinomycetes bacterium]MCP4222461.1 purine-nucleoside phosphorylase [Actinomycetes bacterium]MCP5032385.1 purine-nucleoside phosphorylase [Actinomycetes bacterium]